ncbi:MAG: DUF2147 domain-containing protein [Chitinophagaceae bacterium]|jgi:uncharacterized protein (DUF2147 family)|nr:DUF2147 domain-containing protein [Chitinophagaceae bacterium]
MKRIAFITAVALTITVLFSFTSVQEEADAIIGVWKNGEGTGMIRIYKNGEKYQGKIVWLKEPNDPDTGKPKLDKNHPDESVRTRPVLGMINTWGFEYKGKKLWDDGKIYDPKNGNTYDCTMKLKDQNSLEVRGYIGVSLIGRTDVWTRQVSK